MRVRVFLPFRPPRPPLRASLSFLRQGARQARAALPARAQLTHVPQHARAQRARARIAHARLARAQLTHAPRISHVPRLARAALLVLALGALAAPAPARAQETLRAGPVALHYWPEQRALARRVMDRLEAQPALPALPPDVLTRAADTAGAPGGTIDVYLAPDAARWDSLTGGAIPEWGAGMAAPDAGLIVLPTYDWERTPPYTVYVTLRHELAHVALQRYLGAARTPRWFTEGYAQWAAGEWRWESAWRLRLAFLGRDAPPLDSLTLRWPVGEADARVAYLLSASAVVYLVDRSGVRGLRIFLERWRDSRDFDAAFRATYGATLGQFEEDWRAHVKRTYGWTVLLGQSAFFWLLAAVLLVVLYIIRRRRDRAKLEKLRATEPPDDPAFWEPDGPPAPGPGSAPDPDAGPVEPRPPGD